MNISNGLEIEVISKKLEGKDGKAKTRKIKGLVQVFLPQNSRNIRKRENRGETYKEMQRKCLKT